MDELSQNGAWTPPDKPAGLTEQRLVSAILTGNFPIDSNLPAERELATQLGITRPTLREALQRLGRDGWLEIRQGKPTRVRNYWREGSLGVLAAIAAHQSDPPVDFVTNLLAVRVLLAPAYTHQAVKLAPDAILRHLENAPALPDDAQSFCAFDWDLHHILTIASGNPVFTLILNGFQSLYSVMGVRYFSLEEGRLSSRRFYTELTRHVRAGQAEKAAALTTQIMQESLDLWQMLAS